MYNMNMFICIKPRKISLISLNNLVSSNVLIGGSDGRARLSTDRFCIVVLMTILEWEAQVGALLAQKIHPAKIRLPH